MHVCVSPVTTRGPFEIITLARGAAFTSIGRGFNLLSRRRTAKGHRRLAAARLLPGDARARAGCDRGLTRAVTAVQTARVPLGRPRSRSIGLRSPAAPSALVRNWTPHPTPLPACHGPLCASPLFSASTFPFRQTLTYLSLYQYRFYVHQYAASFFFFDNENRFLLRRLHTYCPIKP